MEKIYLAISEVLERYSTAQMIFLLDLFYHAANITAVVFDIGNT